MDAEKLIQNIKAQLKEIDAKIASHPYLSALDEGQVKKRGFEVLCRASVSHHQQRFKKHRPPGFQRELAFGQRISTRYLAG